QEVEAITDSSGNDNCVETRKLITREVEVGDPSAHTKIARVGTSIDRTYWNNKAQNHRRWRLLHFPRYSREEAGHGHLPTWHCPASRSLHAGNSAETRGDDHG